MGSTLTNLLYHLVFSTKNRMPIICSELQGDLYAYMGGIAKGENGNILEIGGIADHVHLLGRFSPTIAVPDMLRKIKGKSSGWVNREKTFNRRFGWQDGYAAFSVSESQVPIVRRYIKDQEAHHHRQSFHDELIALYEKHNVVYDERYLFS